jgi:hypothetical protein
MSVMESKSTTCNLRNIITRTIRRPQLFDLVNDPNEFTDLGDVPEFETVRQEMQGLLLDRLMMRRNRVTVSTADAIAATDGARKKGILIGNW